MSSRTTRVLVGLALLAACGGGGEGDLTVKIYGEEFIEVGIPADVFADGWSVSFDSFLISVGEVAIAEAGAGPAVDETRFQIFDLAADSGGSGQMVTSVTVPAGAYADTSYVIAPSDGAVAGNASADDVARMIDGGFSVYVVGTAKKGDEELTFSWGFATRTHYTACESQAVVEANMPAAVQLTIHGDHMFLDDLFSETPSVRFDLIAKADGDGDGDITQAELEAVDLRPLEDYQVGSTDIIDLWSFIEQLTSSLGHIDGEGHCESEREA